MTQGWPRVVEKGVTCLMAWSKMSSERGGMGPPWIVLGSGFGVLGSDPAARVVGPGVTGRARDEVFYLEFTIRGVLAEGSIRCKLLRGKEIEFADFCDSRFWRRRNPLRIRFLMNWS